MRKSSTDQNQFVLSGRQNGVIKHLLLVDPDGIVSIQVVQSFIICHLYFYELIIVCNFIKFKC